jgi:hypothetical protein
MKVQYFSRTEFPLDAYAHLIQRLYSGLRPTVGINSYADGTIGVFDGKEVLGLVTHYHNSAYPEHFILGQFESVDHPKVMKLLLTKADELRHQKGKTSLLGPMNGSTWHSYRFRKGVEKPYLMENIHKDYYRDAWLDFGFHCMHAYQTNIDQLDPELRLPQTKSFYQNRGLRTRKMDVVHPADDLRAIYTFCLELFKNNVLFSPISYVEFEDLYQPVLPFLNSELIDLVFDEGVLVGLFFAVPDALKADRVLVKTIARHPDVKYKGLANIMSADFYRNALRMGFTEMLNVYFHLDNASSRVSENYGGQMFQQYDLLIKSST